MNKYLKQVLALLTLSVFCTTYAFADIIRIDDLKGLQRNPKADRIDNGAHDLFDNVYINYGNLQVVKGRDRLNSSAHADPVVNGIFYYENQAGTTKKLVVAESDELVTYNTDGTSRTSIAGPALTNEKWDAVQAGDTLYLTSSTNGLYRWTGAGSATALGSVAAPSSVDFTANATVGGLTPGEDARAVVKMTVTNVTATGSTNYTGVCFNPLTATDYPVVSDAVEKIGILCTAEPACPNPVSGTNFCPTLWTKTCALSTIYKYKVTKYNSTWGIESEASSSDNATLEGANTFDTDRGLLYQTFQASTTCAANVSNQYLQHTATLTDVAKTSTSGTLASAPSAPFDSYRVYRTVAAGSEYFLVGQQSTGAFTDGKADVSLGTPLDTTLDTIAPPSFRYIEEYKGVLFVAENNTIKYTHLPVAATPSADEYWLDSDELQVTGNITGLVKAGDSLLIFTTKSIYQLTGFGVSSFRLTPIVNGIGTVSDDTIKVDTNGDVLFFAGSEGMYKLTIGQQAVDSVGGPLVSQNNARLTKLSSPSLDGVFRGEDTQITLSPSNYSISHAYYDTDNNLYFLYINDEAFIFDAVNVVWTHLPAVQMLASVWRKSPNAAGVGVLIDNVGFFYNNWTGYENGIESGTVTGNPNSSTVSTLTCSTCSFNTTNDGLKGLWIFIDNDFSEYHQIVSNTATAITITGTWTANPITTDDFYIAYIIPHWRTKQYSFTKIPDESHVSILYINHNKSATAQELEVYSFMDKDDGSVTAFPIDLAVRFVHSINTRMRSSWLQWEFRSFVYNISNTVVSPVDIISYAFDVEAEKKVN